MPASSGSDWEGLIAIGPENDLSEDVQGLRAQRGSPRWLWPAAAVGVLGLLGLAVVAGMKIEARKYQALSTQPAAPAPLRSPDAPPAPAGGSIEPPVARDRRPPPPVTGPESGPTRPAREPAVASVDAVKRPSGLDQPDRKPDAPSVAQQPEETKPAPQPVVADRPAKVEANAPPADDDPEAILVNRGLRKEVEAKKICYLVATEGAFWGMMKDVRPAMNRLRIAYDDWDQAMQVRFQVQQLDLAITNVQFDIRELTGQMANLGNGAPDRILKQEIQQAINLKNGQLAELQRQYSVARKQMVSDAKMEELKGEYLKLRKEFQAAAQQLRPIYSKLREEYRILDADEAIKNARGVLATRVKAQVKLGPLSKTDVAMRDVVQLERDVSDDPDAFVRKKRSTRLEGRDAPKARAGGMSR